MTSEKVFRETIVGGRKRMESLSDSTWDRLCQEFNKIQLMKDAAGDMVREELADMREELDLMTIGVERQAKSMCYRFQLYAQIFGFVGPVVCFIIFVSYEHPRVMVMGIVYLLCLVVFLLWCLVMPSVVHRGISYFKPYQFSDLEKKTIRGHIEKASEYSVAIKPQGLWEEKDRFKPTFVLSLDGGGIKGAVSARILARIAFEFPEIMEKVDLIAGCSTGSILAGMLATGFTPEDVCDVFKTASPVVFRTTVWQQLKHLGFIGGSHHDGDGKYKVLEAAFQGKTMKELNCGICITASHVSEDIKDQQCAPRVWSNVVAHTDHAFEGHHEFDKDHGAEEFCVLDMNLADVINGATAAPLYFPSHHGHIDGALWSNNPSSAALATIAPMRDFKNVTLLSISTGIQAKTSRCDAGKWGLTQWLPWLLDFLMDSTATAAHFTSKAMLQERYHRINPTLPRLFALNDVGAVDELNVIANGVDLTSTFAFLDRMGMKRRTKVKVL